MDSRTLILTGDKLDEMCRGIWGADWKSVVARRLKTTRQALHRKSKSPLGQNKAFKRKMLALVDDQLALVAAHRDELHADVGEP